MNVEIWSDVACPWCYIGKRRLGIVSEEARQVAEAARLTVVMERCMSATHTLLGIGPGPDTHKDETS